MLLGGVEFNKNSDRVIRYVALLVAPLFAAYNLLIMFGLTSSSNYVNDSICLIISALWLIIGIYQFFFPVKSKSDVLARLIVYHALAITNILLITGFMQPFASSIALLFLASNVYFGKKGFLYSAISIVLAAAVDAALRFNLDPSIVGQNIIGLVALFVFGVSMVAIVLTQESRHKSTERSRQRERAQSDRLLTIINNLADATFSTDEKGKILMYNAASLDLLDTNENLKGAQLSSLFNLKDGEGEAITIDQLFKGASKETRRDDLLHSYKDGETIRVELTYAPIKSSFSEGKGQTIVGYIMIARDVTKQKSLEEERDEFISVVSHELRTPITIVEGDISNLQLMLEQPKPPENKVIQKSLKSSHDHILYLAKMVNDLSALSRAERGVGEDPEDISVNDLLNTLHSRYQDEARNKKLKLDIDAPARLGSVFVSRLYIEELLQNFITNAIRYTKQGSVTLMARKKGDSIRFTVKDTGIGISRSDQQKIFKKFYRSEDFRIRETNGTGLGLYVSAKLARKLNTEIELTSRLNHGSAFSFELPVANHNKE